MVARCATSGEIANTPEAIQKLVKQLGKAGAKLSFCYEAGPCGYGIHRQLRELGVGLPGGGAVADPEESGRPGQDRPAR